MALNPVDPSTDLPFDCILVPQGAEAAAVRRGLQLAQASTAVFPIAMGPQVTAERLTSALAQGVFDRCKQVLVLGVAGSLSPQLGVGDVVIYDQIVSPSGDPVGVGSAMATLKQRLPQAQAVTALNSDRLLHEASEKQALQTLASAVDMEAAAIAQSFASFADREIAIATVRVISDDIHTTLPDITGATRADGTLNPWGMAWAMLRQPQASFNLIRGSLQALKVLEQTTTQILKTPDA